MTDLTPGTAAAETLRAAIAYAWRQNALIALWDEAATDALNAAAPADSLIASAPHLSAAAFVAGELAQSLQTLGYLGRAVRNLTVTAPPAQATTAPTPPADTPGFVFGSSAFGTGAF